MPTISDPALAELSSRFSGELIRPDDPGYDEARAIFNAMIDRRPALIARARSAEDVAATVRFATDNGLSLAVRGGGHSVGGFYMIDDAVVADCSLMNQVQVDPEARTIVAGPGCRWHDVDTAGGAHGLATPAGTISTTGIAGFTLGGGLGLLSKKFGLACDNLLDAEVVLANGDVVQANESENPDLFWAIRGGGGNFGVVTSFTFRAHPVANVTFGAFLWPAADGLDLVRLYRDYLPTTPPEALGLAAFVSAPPLPFVPPDVVGSDAVLVGVIFLGTPEEAEPWLKPFVERSPMASAVLPLPYTVVQHLLDESAPSGVRNYWRSAYLESAPDEALEVMAAAAPGKGSPMSMIQLLNVGPVPEVDNAFPSRQYPFLYHLISTWIDPAEDEQHVAWSRALSQDLGPFSADSAYLNFIGDEGGDRVRRTFGSKYERLVELKRRYDPGNVFCNNQNIRP